jgi:hypothetical protein
MTAGKSQPGTVIYRAIHKSLWDFRPLRYSSRDDHAEGEHVNRGRDTASFCRTLQLLHVLLLCLSVLVVAQPSSEVPEELPCISVFVLITRLEFVYEAFRSHYKLWENRGTTEQRVTIYMYVCGRSYRHPVYFSVFLQLKCKTVVKAPTHNTIGILSYKDSYYLVHFSSNIACVPPHRVALLWLDENNQSYVAGTARFTSRQFF